MSSHDMTDDEILRQYLLGRLDEEQVDEIEQRLLQDSELFELAEAVEGDLLIAAARGSLSRAERGRVLRRLAATSGGRARYALVRDLVKDQRKEESQPSYPVITGMRAAALAASLVLMAGGGLFLGTHMTRPGSGNGATISAWNQPDGPGAMRGPGRRADEMAKAPGSQTPPPDLSRTREPVPGRDQVAEERPLLPRPDELVPLVFELALSGVRGGEEGVPRLQVPPARQTVEIRLPLDPDVTSTSFDVVLRNAVSGEEIQHQEALAAQDVSGRRTIVLTVPAAKLVPGTYEVYVESPGEGEEREFLGSPLFEVQTP